MRSKTQEFRKGAVKQPERMRKFYLLDFFYSISTTNKKTCGVLFTTAINSKNRCLYKWRNEKSIRGMRTMMSNINNFNVVFLLFERLFNVVDMLIFCQRQKRVRNGVQMLATPSYNAPKSSAWWFEMKSGIPTQRDNINVF